MTANATMVKFGHPDTLVADYAHWCVLARPAQATLGALVLVCKDAAEAFPDISAAAFSELADVTRDIESSLRAFRTFNKINYLMLMMLDKDVHFHVLPRYDNTQSFGGEDYIDAGWPAVPDLSQAVKPADLPALVQALRQAWVA
jgi:diadenosine tetraphosphate (Ap4A) HIT family hydrolase